MFKDIEPYFDALKDTLKQVVIRPGAARRWKDKIPNNLFLGLRGVEKLFISKTRDRLTPFGLEEALNDLPALKTIEIRGNSIPCDCTIPDILAERQIFISEKSVILPVKGCDDDYFSSRIFSFTDFQEECARKGEYTLPDFSNTEFGNYQGREESRPRKKTAKERGFYRNGKKKPDSYPEDKKKEGRYYEDKKKKKPEIAKGANSKPKWQPKWQQRVRAKSRHRHTHHTLRHLGRGQSVDEEPVNSERNGPIAEQGSKFSFRNLGTEC
ncbi:uncharacterized protein [Diadema setosum]